MRWKLFTFLGIALVLSTLGLSFAAEGDEDLWKFKATAARTAVTKYRRDVARAEQEAERQIKAAREALIQELEKAKKAATKAADLKEANRLDAAIVNLREGHAAGRVPGGRVSGTWRITYDNGHWHLLEIRDDGQALLLEIDGALTGMPGRVKKHKRTGEIVLVLEGKSIERLTAVRDRLVVEHFAPPANYPNGDPVLGIGRRVDGRK